ncbi:MAG: GIY-YIG nuclease family protein [Acidimicrobiales bacterium]
MVQRPPAGTIPDTPGSYQFKDSDGRVIYVGKAKNLRARLSNYFQNPRNLATRTRQMVETAESVEWIQVANEVEALMLEFSLIQRHKPRFNVRYTDDKSYPFLCLTTLDEWPRAMVMRGKRKKGNRYFGPFGQAYAIRDTLDLLLRTFPIRTCTDNKFAHHQKLGKPCLLFHIEKCAGPCVGEIDKPAYDGMVAELAGFLEGDTDEIVARLEAQMAEAAEALEFELAAHLPGSPRGRPQGGGEAADGVPRQRGRRRGRPVRRRARGGRAGLLRTQGSGHGTPRLRRRQGRGPRPARTGEPGARAPAYFEDNPVGSPKEVLVPDLSCRSRPLRGVAHGRASPGCASGCRSGATSGRCRRPSRRTPRRASPGTGSSGRTTTTAAPVPSTSSRSISPCPPRRCGSSATT